MDDSESFLKIEDNSDIIFHELLSGDKKIKNQEVTKPTKPDSFNLQAFPKEVQKAILDYGIENEESQQLLSKDDYKEAFNSKELQELIQKMKPFAKKKLFKFFNFSEEDEVQPPVLSTLNYLGSGLTQAEKERIIEFLNDELSVEKIIKYIGSNGEKTKEEAIQDFIIEISGPPKPPPTHCKLLIAKTTGDKLPLYHYESKYLAGRKYYTLLLIGETGSGKTTLLDAFVNKITRINYRDNWRWKLVDENKLSNVTSSQSQTQDITQYYLNDPTNIFNLRIIDTPGFGDTAGVKKDDLIAKKFEQLFGEINEIDYILVTVKASENRLKPGTKYVYDRVQQIFGKDATDRFILMCTFADDKIPLATETLKGHLVYETFFTFNNSAIYTPSYKETPQTKSYWKMAMDNVQYFLDYIRSKDNLPLSLNQSSQVLSYRNYLCESVITSEKSIQNAFKELESARSLKIIIKKNREKIDANKSFTDVQYVEEITKQQLNGTYQACYTCNQTCCQICVWPTNSLVSTCTYFNTKDSCPKCVGKCPKSSHIRTNELIIKARVAKPIVFEAKKKEFEEGKKGLSISEELLKEQTEKIASIVKSIVKSMEDIRSSMRELEKIALKPKLFSDDDFYEQMIQSEEDNKEPGWKDRIDGLKALMEQSKHLHLISNPEKVEDLFQKYQKMIEGITNSDNDSIGNFKCVLF